MKYSFLYFDSVRPCLHLWIWCLFGKRSVSTSGRSVGRCGRWPEVDTYGSVHLGNTWTLGSEQSLRESRRDDGGQWERSAGSSSRL